MPCSPLNTLKETLAAEQTAARGIVLGYEHPQLGSLLGVGLPIQFDGAPRVVDTPPPLLGEHTAEVLADLGFTPAQVAELAHS